MSLPQAKFDWQRFTNNGGFGVDLTLTPPGGEPFLIKGLATKHHNSIGTDGLPVNAKNVRISIIESDLVSLEYPVRNLKGEVSMLKHLVSYIDSTGSAKNFIIKETMPDETIGLITCILGDYGS